jgi:hypothetical protein
LNLHCEVLSKLRAVVEREIGCVWKLLEQRLQRQLDDAAEQVPVTQLDPGDQREGVPRSRS